MYKIVTFTVTIDGVNTRTGQIGSSGEYNQNRVKRTIEEQYKRDFPLAKQIAIVIINAKDVSGEQYMEASKNFIRLTHDNANSN